MEEKISSVIRQFKNIKKIYDTAHIGAYSGRAALFVMLSALPLAVLLASLTGMWLKADFGSVAEVAQDYLSSVVGEYIINVLHQLTQQVSVSVLSVTGVFLLWSATKGVRSIADGVNAVYGTDAQLGFVQKFIRSVGYVVVILLSVLAFGVVGVLIIPLENLLEKMLDSNRWLLLVVNLRAVFVFVLLWFIFTATYKILAKTTITFKQQFVGAAFAALGWQLFSFGYSLYIQHFSSWSVLYGSFGAVMLFMVWLYMCINILLCGALINKLAAERKKCD